VSSIQNGLREESGLTKTSLYQDMNNPAVFHFIEEWATQDSMERYIRSERFSVLMGALKVLCAEAEVTYQIGSGKLGKKIA
jgi:quinol monooxygenase YgiN